MTVRKNLSLVLIAVFLLSALSGCVNLLVDLAPELAYDYRQWKTVELENVGSFMVPEAWILTEKDGILYFTDRPLEEECCTIYMVETPINPYAAVEETDKNPYLGEIRAIAFADDGGNLGNSSHYALWSISMDSQVISRYLIEFDMRGFDGGDRYLFLCADGAIGRDIVIQIAASFSHCFTHL